jgi:RNA polymerase sigma factor for flagellar operon FliA
MRDLLKRLTQQEQTVIRHHYLQEIPFDEIAAHMSLSKGRISQIHRSALQHLRDALSQTRSFDVSL